MSQTTTKTRLGYESIYPNFKRKKSNKTAETQANDLKKQLGKYAALGAATAMAAVVPMRDVSGQIIYNNGNAFPPPPTQDCTITSISNTTTTSTTQYATIPVDLDGGGVDFSIKAAAIISYQTGLLAPAYTMLGPIRTIKQTFQVYNSVGTNEVLTTGGGSVVKLANGGIISGGGSFNATTSMSIATIQIKNNMNAGAGGNIASRGSQFGPGLAATTGVQSNAATGVSTGYVGVRLSSGNYGWIQLEITNDFVFPSVGGGAMTNQVCVRVIDYAYEASGMPITAGATGITPPPGGASIPTVSEWGMMTLVLLMMSFGTLLVYRREEELATGTMSSSWKHVWQNPIFDWAIYQKAFIGTATLAAVLGLISLVTTGTITAVDMIGASIAGPIFAYLAHLMLLFTNKEK